MKYPADIVTDDGWGRIHNGHGLNRDELRRDLEHHVGHRGIGEGLQAQEVYFRYVPRIKWCDSGFCEQEGEWHSHWVEVRPNPNRAYTIAHWVVVESHGVAATPDLVTALWDWAEQLRRQVTPNAP